MPPAKSGPIEQVVDARLRAEQVVLLCQQSLRMEFVSPMVGAAVCVGLWPLVEHRLLLGWLLLLTVMTALRLALARRFETSAVAARDAGAWERRFVASLGGVGLLWGIGGWLMMPGASLAGEAFTFVFLVGMSGSVIATFAVHPPSVRVTVTAMLGPAVLYFCGAARSFTGAWRSAAARWPWPRRAACGWPTRSCAGRS